jgi:hypothetical protein
VFGIPVTDFGVDLEEDQVYRFSLSGDFVREIVGALDDLRDVFREWRETRAALEAQAPARKPSARAAVDMARAGPEPPNRPATREEG